MKKNKHLYSVMIVQFLADCAEFEDQHANFIFNLYLFYRK